MLVIPRDVWDGAPEEGLQVQALMCVDDPIALTVDVGVSVMSGSDVVASDVLTVPACCDRVEYDLGSFDVSSAADVVCMVDGMDGVWLADGVLFAFDGDTKTLSMAFEPLLVDGIMVFVHEDKSGLVREALGVELDAMQVYPYGSLAWRHDLVEGLRFTYKGRFKFPNTYGIGLGDDRLPGHYAYLAARNVLYGWFSMAQNEYEGVMEYYMQPIDSSLTWNDIKSKVMDGPYTSDSDFIENRHSDDGTYMCNAYFGQMMTLPGAEGTSDFTFADEDWFSSLAQSDIVGNDSLGAGYIPSFCMHVAQASVYDWDQWIDCTIDVTVLAVHMDGDSGYAVMSFTTREGERNNVGLVQATGVILKIRLERTSGFLRMQKEVNI